MTFTHRVRRRSLEKIPEEVERNNGAAILDEHAEELIRRIEGREKHPPCLPSESDTFRMGRLYAEITTAFPELREIAEGMTLPAWAYTMGFIADTYRKHYGDDDELADARDVTEYVFFNYGHLLPDYVNATLKRVARPDEVKRERREGLG